MIKCPVCAGGSSVIWRERQHRLYRCRKCRIVFLHPVPKNSSAIYNEDYFRKWYIGYYPQRKAYIEKLFSGIEQYAGTKGKMLDVGCGAGILLDVAKESGWEVFGQDVSSFAVDYCRGKGLEVYACSLTELNLPENSFDLITMFDVIAHLGDPVSYLKSCTRLLKPGGYLAIKTPYHPPSLFLLANLLSFTGKSRSLLHVPAQIFHFDRISVRNLPPYNNFALFNMMQIKDFDSFQKTVFFKKILSLLEKHKSLVVIWRKG